MYETKRVKFSFVVLKKLFEALFIYLNRYIYIYLKNYGISLSLSTIFEYCCISYTVYSSMFSFLFQ